MSKKVTEIKSGDSNNGLAVALFAIWALGLLIAFLAYRGADAGNLPELIRGMGGPVFGWEGLRDSLLGLVISGLIFLAWYGLGSLITSFIKITDETEFSATLGFAHGTAVGAAAWSLIWFFLGLAGFYNKTVAAVLLLIGLGLAAWQIARSRSFAANPITETSGWTVFDRALLILSAVPVVLATVSALAPPTAKDSLLYHMSAPKAFVAQGGSAFIDGNIASYLSLGTEMHSVWAMLLGGFFSQRVSETAAGATIFLFFPLLLLAIYGWARELNLSRSWRLLAVLIFASIPTAFYVAGSAYIDLALALYVTLAIYALGRWWNSLDARWLVFIAIFLGAALAVKLTTLFVFIAFTLIILLRARQAQNDTSASVGKSFGGGIAALIGGGLIAAPWYLRTWAATGSPIFPFYMNVWKGQANGWDIDRSVLFQAMNSRYGGISKGALDYLLMPFRISIFAQPEQAIFFDGVIGIIFLFGLPVLIWALWKYTLPVEIKIALAICLVMFLFWIFSSEQLRYLLPVFPALGISICAAAQLISNDGATLRRAWQGSLTVLALAGTLTTVAWFLQKAPLRVVLGGESRGEYLTRSLDYYPFYQLVAEQTPPDARVWLINMRRDSYNLDRPYFSDYLFEDWTIKKLVWESRDVNELRAKVRQMNIDYILARHDILLNFAQSAIVDDKKTKQENENKLKMLNELFFDPANTLRSDNKFSLTKIS